MSIFKEIFDPSIVKSLALRQELMGKENRTPKELTFLNSKTSWVSLKSAVDIDNSSNLAQTNVLEGGSLFNGKLRYGVGVEASNAYSLKATSGETNTLGIRPMPGITSVTIENIGAYGSTRRATITYQCWDVKQLEVLEQLYMRPGYLVLLEFGRTIYLENENGINNIKQVAPDYDFFGKKNIVLLDELKALYEKSTKSGGNYDAFLGYVVNYGWQVRSDGGYECKTEIISTGEVLESLKTNYSLATDVNFEGIDAGLSTFRGLLFPSFKQTMLASADLKQLNQDYAANILLGLTKEIYLLGKYNYSDALLPAPTIPNKFTVTVNKKLIDIDIVKSYYGSTNDESYGRLQQGSKLNYYVTLESFLNLINEIIIPISIDGEKGPLTKLSVRDRDYLNKSDQLKCLYNSLMTSVDPDICLIRNDDWGKVLGGLSIDVSIGAIHVVPKAYEATLNTPEANALREKIKRFIAQLPDTNDYSNITSNIYEDYKNWKTKNPKKQDAEYFKFFQQVYQTIRGGINPGVRTPKTITVNGQLLTSETEFNTSDPTRSWTGLRSSPTLVNTLRDKLGSTKDKRFWDLLTNIKSGASNTGTTPNQKYIAKGLTDVSNDTALDLALDTQQSITNEALQNAKKSEEIKEATTELGKTYLEFLKSIPNSFSTTASNGNRRYGIIGNIYLNLKYLHKLADDPNLKTQDSSGKSSLLLAQYITTLIKDVQASIGNVNNFELHIDDRDGIGRIIDLNYVSKEKPNFSFEIGTNKSIIRDLKIESKIFSDQVSMIAISAQGDSGRLGFDNSTLVAFNKGITDRMISKKDSPSVINQSREINNLISSLSGLVTNFFDPYMKGYFEGTSAFDSSKASSFKDYLRDVIVFFTDKFNTDNKNSMILPTQVSFTLDGIAGLVIGNLFSIDKTFIPKSYKDKNKDLGYIVVKVGHQIQNNDWTTTIDGYPFIPEIDPIIKNPDNFSIVVLYDPYTGSAVSGLSVPSSITTKQQNANILKVYNSLRNWYGLTPEQAAGIIGNALRESSLNPTAKTIDTNGLPSGGIFQWNGERYNRLVANYPNWTNIDNQLFYLKSELDSTYKKVINSIRTTTGTSRSVVETSNYIWASEFEKCAECVKGKDTTEIALRLNFSLKALDVIQHPEKYLK